jgi:CheY-like chemotaxis protein
LIEATGKFDKISFFSNGKEAFQGLSQLFGTAEFPQIILLDINMPIWDAWDFLDELNKENADIASSIYVVSSSNDPEDEQRAKAYAQVKGFLLKPIQLNQLNFGH